MPSHSWDFEPPDPGTPTVLSGGASTGLSSAEQGTSPLEDPRASVGEEGLPMSLGCRVWTGVEPVGAEATGKCVASHCINFQAYEVGLIDRKARKEWQNQLTK